VSSGQALAFDDWQHAETVAAILPLMSIKKQLNGMADFE
jgi:hypothetical protein